MQVFPFFKKTPFSTLHLCINLRYFFAIALYFRGKNNTGDVPAPGSKNYFRTWKKY
jgi:hypothetical protein